MCAFPDAPSITGANAALTNDCDGGLRKLLLEVQGLRPAGQQHVLHLQVDRDVSASEAIDRLFGIADEEEFARNGQDAKPIALLGVI
jgi:hypothetical protein